MDEQDQAATNSQTIQKLKNGKTYYFQVRVKDQYKDSPVYWSRWKTVKVKAATTGWKTVIKKGKKNGKKYYYVNGVMQKNKEFWLGKLKYYVDKNGVWRGGSKYMWNRCKKQTSGTDTMLVTSRNRHTVCIFKKVDGTWCCQYEWLCSVGKNGSKTPHGKFFVRSKKRALAKVILAGMQQDITKNIRRQRSIPFFTRKEAKPRSKTEDSAKTFPMDVSDWH